MRLMSILNFYFGENQKRMKLLFFTHESLFNGKSMKMIKNTVNIIFGLFFLFFIVHNDGYCQLGGDVEVIPKLYNLNLANFEAIRTWKGRVDVLYSVHEKNLHEKGRRHYKRKYIFALDNIGKRAMYLAEQYEAGGYRDGKDISLENEIRWGAIWTPDGFFKVNQWDPTGNSFFTREPTLIIEPKPDPYSDYAEDFHPLENQKYFELSAHEFLKDLYKAKDLKHLSVYHVKRKDNLVEVSAGDRNKTYNSQTFDINKSGNRIETATESRTVKIESKWGFEKIGDLWICNHREVTHFDKTKNQEMKILWTFSENVVNEPLSDDLFNPNILSKEKVFAVRDKRTGSVYKQPPKKAPLPEEKLLPAPPESTDPPDDPTPTQSSWLWVFPVTIVPVGILLLVLYFRRSP